MKAVFGLIWLGAVLGTIFELYRHELMSRERAGGNRIAKIFSTSGETEFRGAGKFDWASANDLEYLNEEEYFSTRANSKATLYFTGSKKLELGPNTMIKIDKPHGLDGGTEIFLLSGEVKAVSSSKRPSKKSGKPNKAHGIALRIGKTRVEIADSKSMVQLKKTKAKGLEIKNVKGVINLVQAGKKVRVKKAVIIKEKPPEPKVKAILDVPSAIANRASLVAKSKVVKINVAQPVIKPPETKPKEIPVPVDKVGEPEVPKKVKKKPKKKKRRARKPKPKKVAIQTIRPEQLNPQGKPVTLYLSSLKIGSSVAPRVSKGNQVRGPYIISVPDGNVKKYLPLISGADGGYRVGGYRGLPRSGLFGVNAKGIVAGFSGPFEQSPLLHSVRKLAGADIIYRGKSTDYLLADQIKGSAGKGSVYLISKNKVTAIRRSILAQNANIDKFMASFGGKIFGKKVTVVSGH